MTDFYMEAPHLTIAVYSDQDERQTFAQLCTVPPKFECSPTYKMEVAAAELDFEMIFDLEDREILTASPDRYNRIIAGLEPGLRALVAEYSHRKYGNALVEYGIKKGSDAHPVSVSLGAGDLGFPDFLWSAEQRREAYAIADWTLAVLKSAVAACKPLYGAVGVEYSLPTPGNLVAYRSGLPTEWFVSRALLNHDPSLEEELRTIYIDGAVTDWAEGIFCSGSDVYNSERLTVNQPSQAARDTAEVLGRVLADFRQRPRGSD